MRKAVSLLIIGSLTCAMAAYSQERWIPYTAKFTETIQNVNVKGERKIIQHQGITVQSSNGTRMEESFLPNSTKPEKGTLNLPGENLSYSIDFRAQRAIGRTVNLGRIKHLPRTDPIGHEVIGGVAATGYRTLDPVTKKAVGEIWFADRSSDIIVRMTTTLDNGGSAVHELSDVAIGQEPDESLLRIPSGFAVSKP
jgi:hypothetical protein